MNDKIMMALKLAEPNIQKFTDKSLLKDFRYLMSKGYVGLTEYRDDYDVWLNAYGQKLKDQLGLS